MPCQLEPFLIRREKAWNENKWEWEGREEGGHPAVVYSNFISCRTLLLVFVKHISTFIPFWNKYNAFFFNPTNQVYGTTKYQKYISFPVPLQEGSTVYRSDSEGNLPLVLSERGCMCYCNDGQHQYWRLLEYEQDKLNRAATSDNDTLKYTAGKWQENHLSHVHIS